MKIKKLVGDEKYNSGCFKEAVELFKKMTRSKEYPDFLTLPAYELLEG